MSQSIRLSLKQVIVTPLLGLCALFVSAVEATEESQSLDKRQAAMIPIAALTASGDVKTLNDALKVGLENGLTVNEIKEILTQMGLGLGMKVDSIMKQVQENESN